MSKALLAISFALAASPLTAQPARITSAYTSLDLDRCKLIEQDQAFALWRCKGYGGIPLFVEDGDLRHDIDAGRQDDDEFYSNSFDSPGKTVEWRLAGGKPFAIIYRLDSANPEASRWSRLIVETIGRASPGCRIATINARTRGANQQARRAADSTLSHPVRCLAGGRASGPRP